MLPEIANLGRLLDATVSTASPDLLKGTAAEAQKATPRKKVLRSIEAFNVLPSATPSRQELLRPLVVFQFSLGK